MSPDLNTNTLDWTSSRWQSVKLHLFSNLGNIFTNLENIYTNACVFIYILSFICMSRFCICILCLNIYKCIYIYVYLFLFIQIFMRQIYLHKTTTVHAFSCQVIFHVTQVTQVTRTTRLISLSDSKLTESLQGPGFSSSSCDYARIKSSLLF